MSANYTNTTGVFQLAPQANSDDKGLSQDLNLSMPLRYVCTDDIEFSTIEFNALVECLLPSEREKVMKYRVQDDRKRSVLSILLQRKTIRDKLRCDDDDYQISRTRESKPYAVSNRRNVSNWNYNVSHHGAYVGIVSNADYIVGADIVKLEVRESWDQGAAAYIDLFQDMFTPAERRFAKSHHIESNKYRHFFVNWSLKEAYIKAVGMGLQMDLHSLHFVISFEKGLSPGECRGTAQLYILNRIAKGWSFAFRELDEFHVFTIARGPLDDVSSSYAKAANISESSQPKTPPAVCRTSQVTSTFDVHVKRLHLEDLMAPEFLCKWQNKVAALSDDVWDQSEDSEKCVGKVCGESPRSVAIFSY